MAKKQIVCTLTLASSFHDCSSVDEQAEWLNELQLDPLGYTSHPKRLCCTVCNISQYTVTMPV